MRAPDPDTLDCCWCPARRFKNRTLLNAHEADHAEADRRMRLREVRPSAAVTAERFEAAAAAGAAQSPPSKP